MTLKTLEEWEVYVSRLYGQQLWSKAVNANTQAFVDRMLADGWDLMDVQDIVLFFVRQCCLTGQKIPEGGAFDMIGMSRRDPLARHLASSPISEAEVAAKAATAPASEPDELDDLD